MGRGLQGTGPGVELRAICTCVRDDDAGSVLEKARMEGWRSVRWRFWWEDARSRVARGCEEDHEGWGREGLLPEEKVGVGCREKVKGPAPGGSTESANWGAFLALSARGWPCRVGGRDLRMLGLTTKGPVGDTCVVG